MSMWNKQEEPPAPRPASAPPPAPAPAPEIKKEPTPVSSTPFRTPESDSRSTATDRKVGQSRRPDLHQGRSLRRRRRRRHHRIAGEQSHRRAERPCSGQHSGPGGHHPRPGAGQRGDQRQGGYPQRCQTCRRHHHVAHQHRRRRLVQRQHRHQEAGAQTGTGACSSSGGCATGGAVYCDCDGHCRGGRRCRNQEVIGVRERGALVNERAGENATGETTFHFPQGKRSCLLRGAVGRLSNQHRALRFGGRIGGPRSPSEKRPRRRARAGAWSSFSSISATWSGCRYSIAPAPTRKTSTS